MKFMKMLGLVTVALAVATAIVGVSSALATELEEVVFCKEQVAVQCPLGKDFGAGTVVHGELVNNTKAVLLGGLTGNIECATATFLLTTGATLLAHGEITSLEFGGCTWLGRVCTLTREHLNYLFKGELNAAHTGYEALVTEKGANGVPQFRLQCEGLDCRLNTTSLLLTAEANANDTILKVEQVLNRVMEGTCPVGTTWDARYLTRCLESGSIELKPCWLQME